MQGHKRGVVHLHRMYRPVRMLRASIALLVAILVLAALSQHVSLRKNTARDAKPVSDASVANKLNAYNSTIATSPLARVDRLIFAAHLNTFDANNLVQHTKLPSHVQALLAAVADFADPSEQPNNPEQGFLQLKLRQNESPFSMSSHKDNTAVSVKLSIVLTCVGFGHTCSPTCPSPSATLSLHPMFKILPIDCPGNGSKLAKTVYNASTNALAAWKAASEWWASQLDKKTLARSAMLLLSERVVGFETSDWLWELLNRGKSPHAIAISGVLAHGSPNSYHQTQWDPRSTVKSGWVQNVGITFRMSGLRATVEPPEVKPGEQFDWEWLPKIVKPVPVHFRQGFEAGSQGTLLSNDDGTNGRSSSREDEDEIFGVGGDVSIVSLQAVMMSGGFHAGYYDNALAVVDLCLWARENGLGGSGGVEGSRACIVHGESIALAPFFDYDELYIRPTLTRRLAPEFVRQDIDLMHERHGPTILAGILNNLWLDKTVTIVYDSVWGKGCSGWSAEILPYLVALESRVFSIIASTTDEWCSGMYPYYKGVIERQRLNPIQHKPSKEFPLIFINHVQGGFYSKYPSHNWINNWFVYLPSAQPWLPVFVKPTIRIGRSMTETNTLSKNSYFPAGFAKGVDHVWVPAPFLVDVFEKTGGCRKGSVKVARETVDLLHFDTHRKSGMRVPEDLRGLRDSRWFEWLRRKEDAALDLNTAAGSPFKEFAVGHVAQDGTSELQNITIRSNGGRKSKNLFMKTRGEMYLPAEDEPCQFIFLAVFKWEPRKDPENLIRAFLQTFGLDSGVCLLISTKVAGRGVDSNQVHDHSRIYSSIQKIVDEIAWEHDWDPRGYQPPAALQPNSPISYVENTPDSGRHWDKKLKPVRRPDRSITHLSKAIKVTTQLREWEELPAMYKVADAYVSSSHGEGWGLPVHEAMAMELPVIASATTGHLAFVNSQNSWPVALEMERGKPKKVKVPAESEQDFGPLAHWDLVDWKHLSAMMLSVVLQKYQMMDDARRRGLDTLDAVRDEYEIGSKPRRARAWLQQTLSPNKVIREWTDLASEAVRAKRK